MSRLSVWAGAAGLSIMCLLPSPMAWGQQSDAPVSADATAIQEPTDPVHGQDHDHAELEEIVVTATPLARNVVEMSQSATILSGVALEREVANNIGDTLSRIPGLSNASFGQNIGRPVIRGFEGARVGMLNNNMAAADASAVSQDHAVSIEPFLADQIEVLRGPATLLYGSGAIGGVVNIVTHVIPEEIPRDGPTGRALIQADSAADQRLAAGRLDLGGSSFAFHANAFYRRTDDYDIPGEAELYPDSHDEESEETTGTLENSFLDNDGGSLGASWIGDTWRFGLAYTTYNSDYGIPGAHAHEGEEDHSEEHGEEAGSHEEEEEELVTIGLKSDRLDGELTGTNPIHGVEQIKLRFAQSDYEHTEFEGAEIGTVFTNKSNDLRLEVRHRPWGRWSGAFGAQYSDRDFAAEGEEAFVPASETKTAALFWVENADFGDWQWDLGFRYDSIRIDPIVDQTHGDTTSEPLPDRRFSPFSASLGAVWHLTDSRHLAFNLTHAERAPTDQELYAFGPHIATQTYEVGDSDLTSESNWHLEAGYRVHQGQLTGSVTLFLDRFDDYIFQLDTGNEADGLPVRRWSQQDATFHGAEVELRYDLGRFDSGHWQLTAFADVVRAEFSDNSRVPRIPPARIGFGVDWDRHGWASNLTWISASRQNRIAEYETPTPGYDLLNADISYLFPTESDFDWEIYLKAQNLLDEDIRNSTSFLKDQAPQIGRNFVVGIRTAF